MFAARHCGGTRKRLSLPPGSKITMSVPSRTSLSMRRSISPVVSKGTPALVTWASMPLARSRACNCAGYAPSLRTYQPWVLLAPIATMRSGAAVAVMFAHINVAKANRAAPPSRVMKSYCFIRSPRRAGEERRRHVVAGRPKDSTPSDTEEQVGKRFWPAAFEVDEAYATSEREPRCALQRHHRPQAKDLVPPCHREAVAVGVAAFVPHPALAERELVLRVHQRGGGARPQRVDATRAQHAVGDDLRVLARAHRAPDFPGELLADHSPFAHAASPQRQRREQEERQEDRELEQRAADEGLHKPQVERIGGRRRLTRRDGRERHDERQRVVDHVCRNRQNEAGDRREDADPGAPRLHRDAEEGAEDARGHRVAAEAEERVAAAELQAIGRRSCLRVALRHVQRRLEPIEPDA